MPGAPEPTYVLTHSGVDHLGIIHAITHQLARHRVSITDLQTRRLDDAETPLNATMLEIIPPPGADIVRRPETRGCGSPSKRAE